MIILISPTHKMRRTIQSYLKSIVVKIPMTLEIKQYKKGGSISTSTRTPVRGKRKAKTSHALFSEGAFGGVVFNTALNLQGVDQILPDHALLHSCDVRKPERIAQFEEILRKKGRYASGAKSKQNSPKQQP
jgi:hypothetical protein